MFIIFSFPNIARGVLCNISQKTDFCKVMFPSELVGSRSGTCNSYSRAFCVSLAARMLCLSPSYISASTGSWVCPVPYLSCSETTAWSRLSSPIYFQGLECVEIYLHSSFTIFSTWCLDTGAVLSVLSISPPNQAPSSYTQWLPGPIVRNERAGVCR